MNPNVTKRRKSLLVVRLMGGLGNQMFQCAAGIALSQKMGRQLLIDVSLLGENSGSSVHDIIRDFELSELFCGPFHFASRMQTDRLYPVNTRLCSRITSFVLRRFRPAKLHIQDENHWMDIPDSDLDLIGIVGRFQDAEYFDLAIEHISKAFRFKPSLSEEGKKLRTLWSGNSCWVAVHVRRGDYVTHPVYSKTIGFVGKDYIDRALEYFRKEINSPQFVFFSDDPEWCETNYGDVGTVHKNAFCRNHAHSDFMLLTAFRNVIIANSTFSWWAGKFAEMNNGAQIVAPKVWTISISEDHNPAQNCKNWKLL